MEEFESGNVVGGTFDGELSLYSAVIVSVPFSTEKGV